MERLRTGGLTAWREGGWGGGPNVREGGTDGEGEDLGAFHARNVVVGTVGLRERRSATFAAI